MFAIKIIDETLWEPWTEQWQDFHFPIGWKMVFLPSQEIRHHGIQPRVMEKQWEDFLRQFFLTCG